MALPIGKTQSLGKQLVLFRIGNVISVACIMHADLSAGSLAEPPAAATPEDFA